MASPEDLHSLSYYNRLRTCRNEALLHSKRGLGRISLLKNVSFGLARARWQSEEGGAVWLSDRGLRIGKRTLGVRRPTVMTILDTDATSEHYTATLTTYYMELDNKRLIDVYDTTIDEESKPKLLAHILGHSYGLHLNMHEPTDAQRSRLERELQRGASGDYTPGPYNTPS